MGGCRRDGNKSVRRAYPRERRALGLGGFDEAAEEGGDGFEEELVGGAEGGGEVAFDVKEAGERAFGEERNHHFGFDHVGAGEIAGVVGDVLNDDGFARGSGGSAEAAAERDALVGGKAADVGANDEIAGIGFVGKIEADPVVAGHGLVETLGDLLHEGIGGGGRACGGFEFGEEIGAERNGRVGGRGISHDGAHGSYNARKGSEQRKFWGMCLENQAGRTDGQRNAEDAQKKSP